MKKSVVVVLILSAAIVLVSPAIVGRLAEKSMDENLNWAAQESGELNVTFEHFQRGWFSSEGQHRIELNEGNTLSIIQALTGPLEVDDLPVLIINTRLDHGLIPVASMSRDEGSLAPGLGSAVSTVQVELADGQLFDLPGTIYSKISLGGELHSNYVLEAGSRSADGMNASWGDADIHVTTNPSSGQLEFNGTISELKLGDGEGGLRFNGLAARGRQKPTGLGFSTGDIELAVENLSIGAVGMVGGMEVHDVDARMSAAIEGDRVDTGGSARVSVLFPGEAENFDLDLAAEITGLDAEAYGAVYRAAKDAGKSRGPGPGFEVLEAGVKRLFAKGFSLDVSQYDVTLPEGRVSTRMSFNFAAEDPDNFEWTTLLLSTEGTADVSIPVELVEKIGPDNPQLAFAIGSGYLARQGDNYVLKAEMKKGLLTVNGAPIPIPLGF